MSITTNTLNFYPSLDDLPYQAQRELQEFVHYLRLKYVTSPVTPNKRLFGIDAGKGWISEDFNAPLPESILRELVCLNK